MKIVGTGECVGDVVVSNHELALELGLEPNWFEKRTGIQTRRVAGPDQDSLSMAAIAVSGAMSEAGLISSDLGHETVLVHIQNGLLPNMTPPGAIQLSAYMGLDRVRPLGIDGVCAEPIAALQIAELLLEQEHCERVIVSAASDFLAFIDPDDKDTAGLFGAGAGALIATRSPLGEESAIRGLRWETHSAFSHAGHLAVIDIKPGPGHVMTQMGYYLMNGSQLATVAMEKVPPLVRKVLAQAGWGKEDIDYVISHQPNAKLLEMTINRLGLGTDRVALPVRTHGNMGAASLLVTLSQARMAGAITNGSRTLLISFGLGFSCGAVAVVL